MNNGDALAEPSVPEYVGSIVCHCYRTTYESDKEVFFRFIHLLGHSPTILVGKNKEAVKNGQTAEDSAKPTTASINGPTLTQSSIFIWIGDNRACLTDLHCSFPTRYENATTQLMGEDEAGGEIAHKLSTKFKMPIFLSVDLAIKDERTLLSIQKTLIEQIGMRNSWSNEGQYMSA